MPVRRWQHGSVRRLAGLAFLAFALAACSSGGGRSFARYYDPQGLFTANLPAANDITVTPPQPSSNGPAFLAGVVAAPPQPSPSSQSSIGGLSLTQAAPADQTVYEAFVVTTDSFPNLAAMSLFFLTRDPSVDVQVEQGLPIDGTPGRLVVADIRRNGQVSSSVAAAMSLGRDGSGYLVAAIFPTGGWDSERDDFLRVVSSFHAGIPPGLETFPLTSSGA